MPTLTIKIKAVKPVLVISSFSLKFKRGTLQTKTAAVPYTGGSGQALTAGQVLYTDGQAGQAGYLVVKSLYSAVLSGSGEITLSVEHHPAGTAANQTTPVTILGKTVDMSLSYFSNPVVQDLTISLENRAVKTFGIADFSSKYSDYDSDLLSEVAIMGDVSGWQLSNAPYSEGTWIPIGSIANLRYVSRDTNDAYNVANTWKAKDSSGDISSNAANIIMIVAEAQQLVFSPFHLKFLRESQTTQTATVQYKGGSGQELNAGQVIYSQGEKHYFNYTHVTSVNSVTLNGSGELLLSVTHLPPEESDGGLVQLPILGKMAEMILSYHTRPTIEQIKIKVANRAVRTFTAADFINKFSDADGDTLTEIAITGMSSEGLYLANQPYQKGTWVPISSIENLKFVGRDIDSEYELGGFWQAKDSQNTYSSFGFFSIIASSKFVFTSRFPRDIEFSVGVTEKISGEPIEFTGGLGKVYKKGEALLPWTTTDTGEQVQVRATSDIVIQGDATVWVEVWIRYYTSNNDLYINVPVYANPEKTIVSYARLRVYRYIKPA